MAEITKLAKHGLIYSITSIMAQVVSLFVVPIFTKNMSLRDFGQYNLLMSIQTLLAIFITLGIYSGLSRFINEFEDKNRTKNIALTFSLAWGILMCLLSVKFGNDIYDIVFSSENNGGEYINLLVFSSVLICLISIYNSYYTMLYKSKLVSIINLSRAVLLLLFAAYFVFLSKNGLEGALLAQLCASALVLVGLIIYDWKNFRLVLSVQEIKLMLNYGLGLLPGEASAWIYTLIDRYFIKAMIGLQQVAIYSLGYRIGMMMEPVVLMPFKSVFTPIKYSTYQEAGAPEKFREIFGYYSFFGWFCIFGFSVFARPAIAWLSTPEYGEAFRVVPLIVFSYFLNGLGEFYSLGIHIRKKSLVDSCILGLGALLNVVLNFVLIPVLGIMGAALATVLSYLSMNVLYYRIGKRYLDFGLHYFPPFKGGILFIGLYSVYLLSLSLFAQPLHEFLYAALLCLVFILFGVLLGLVPREAVKSALLQLARQIGLPKAGDKHGS